MTYETRRNRDGAAVLSIATAVSVNFTPGDTVSHAISIPIAASNFTTGDVLTTMLFRDGAHASDTMVGCVCEGAYLTYTGYLWHF